MPDATIPDTPISTPSTKAYRVRRSRVHGRGVFALRDIHAGEKIIQYRGREITWDMALERAAASGAPHNHTFFFSLSNGNVVDGGDHGNVARYINHSCEPNCEAIEEEDGRIFIHAIHEICAGDELNYSYPLVYDGRHTAAIKRAFACYCGTPSCSGTMLEPKKRARRKPAKPGAEQASPDAAPAPELAPLPADMPAHLPENLSEAARVFA
jgi:SET domain-containing protein